MHEVQIIYKGKTKLFTAPSSWSECTKSDLEKIAKILLTNSGIADSRFMITMRLCGISLRLFASLSSEQKNALVNTCNFIEQERVLDKNIIPSFSFRLRKYFGPNSDYDNVQGLEFAYAEISYLKYIETKEMSYLDDLVAILYRPRKFFNITNDVRKCFYLRSANTRAKAFARIPDALKLSIFLNYEAWRNWLINEHPHIFPKNTTADEEEEENDNPTSGSLWTKAYRMIAESGVFGNYNEVGQQPVLVLFVQIEEKILEVKLANSKTPK